MSLKIKIILYRQAMKWTEGALSLLKINSEVWLANNIYRLPLIEIINQTHLASSFID